MKIAAAANSVESSPTVPEKPEIELEFIGEKPGSDGSFPVERAKAVSGEKLLRNIMLDNKIELYAPYGKLMNCGAVEAAELALLRICLMLLHHFFGFDVQKPESWRLACQTIVGNKENSGKVVVQRLPQWKK
ncbi:Photosynthetic NDH subunit of subcomplex B 3, chloroplastic [Vitis vinifera]|uniref:Photosynthetic NDH subunit of subcomplex B 3, chloroplastic n=2 Tax=Vitis vinifera TaxID=29760 RepID=A0A438KEV8_VITVI|nr:Photosynthetic NDH subunit of subcomplex B 3, chloroplastic [Vitis vinifera]